MLELRGQFPLDDEEEKGSRDDDENDDTDATQNRRSKRQRVEKKNADPDFEYEVEKRNRKENDQQATKPTILDPKSREKQIQVDLLEEIKKRQEKVLLLLP